MGEIVGPSCDHNCAVHSPVKGAEIIGGMLTPEQAYKRMSPEARKIVDQMRRSVDEFHEATRQRIKESANG